MRNIARLLLAKIVGSHISKLALAGQESVVRPDIADSGAESAKICVMCHISATTKSVELCAPSIKPTALTLTCPGS